MSAYPNRPRALALAVMAAGLAAVALLRLPGLGQDQDPEAVRAKQAIEEALKKDPLNSELWLHLGFACKKLQDVDGSQKAFEKTVELNPKSASAHYMLGLIYEKKKLKEKAIAAWKACLKHATEPQMKEIAEKHLHHLEKQ